MWTYASEGDGKDNEKYLFAMSVIYHRVLTEFQSYPFGFFLRLVPQYSSSLGERGVLLTQQNETLGQYSEGKIKISQSGGAGKTRRNALTI